MSRFAGFLAIAVVGAALAQPGSATAQPGSATAQSDAGIVTRQTGGTARLRAGNTPIPVTPFMKLRVGDRLDVPAGVSLRVTYLKSGASEEWSGPAAFTAGESGSADGSGTMVASPPARNAPDARELAKIGNLATSRMGAVVVRSLRPPNPALDQARVRYEQWKSGTPAGDMLPHLYWLGAVRELSGETAFRSELESLRRQFPEAPELQALDAGTSR